MFSVLLVIRSILMQFIAMQAFLPIQRCARGDGQQQRQQAGHLSCPPAHRMRLVRCLASLFVRFGLMVLFAGAVGQGRGQLRGTAFEPGHPATAPARRPCGRTFQARCGGRRHLPSMMFKTLQPVVCSIGISTGMRGTQFELSRALAASQPVVPRIARLARPRAVTELASARRRQTHAQGRGKSGGRGLRQPA